MGIETDLLGIAEQERRLVFAQFGAEEAWRLGCWLRAAAVAKRVGMTFEVRVGGRVLFLCATEGAPAGQMDWIRRKRNVVERFGRSSYAVGLELAATGKTIEQRHGLTLAEYAMHGGGFPLALRGTGMVGTVVVSGLPQREDHAMVVEGLKIVMGVAVEGLGEERA